MVENCPFCGSDQILSGKGVNTGQVSVTCTDCGETFRVSPPQPTKVPINPADLAMESLDKLVEAECGYTFADGHDCDGTAEKQTIRTDLCKKHDRYCRKYGKNNKACKESVDPSGKVWPDHCPKCGGDWQFYDGALGYQTRKCESCGTDINDVDESVNEVKWDDLMTDHYALKHLETWLQKQFPDTWEDRLPLYIKLWQTDPEHWSNTEYPKWHDMVGDNDLDESVARCDEMDPVSLFNAILDFPPDPYSAYQRSEQEWYETDAVEVMRDMWHYNHDFVPQIVDKNKPGPVAHPDRIAKIKEDEDYEKRIRDVFGEDLNLAPSCKSCSHTAKQHENAQQCRGCAGNEGLAKCNKFVCELDEVRATFGNTGALKGRSRNGNLQGIKTTKYYMCNDCEAGFSSVQCLGGKFPPHNSMQKPCPGSGQQISESKNEAEEQVCGYCKGPIVYQRKGSGSIWVHKNTGYFTCKDSNNDCNTLVGWPVDENATDYRECDAGHEHKTQQEADACDDKCQFCGNPQSDTCCDWMTRYGGTVDKNESSDDGVCMAVISKASMHGPEEYCGEPLPCPEHGGREIGAGAEYESVVAEDLFQSAFEKQQHDEAFPNCNCPSVKDHNARFCQFCADAHNEVQVRSATCPECENLIELTLYGGLLINHSPGYRTMVMGLGLCPGSGQEAENVAEDFGGAGDNDAQVLGPQPGIEDGPENIATSALTHGTLDPTLNDSEDESITEEVCVKCRQDANRCTNVKGLGPLCGFCYSHYMSTWEAIGEGSDSSDSGEKYYQPGSQKARSGAESADPDENICPAYFEGGFCRVDGRVCPYTNETFKQCPKLSAARSFTARQMVIQDGLDGEDEKIRGGFDA
jgi:hypothetical protein